MHRFPPCPTYPTLSAADLLNTPTTSILCRNLLSPNAKQVERHHFHRLQSLRETHMTFKNFRLFQLFDPGSHNMLCISNSSFLSHPDFFRRLPWTIQCTGDSIHRCLFASLPLHRRRPNFNIRRKEAWQSLASCGNCAGAWNNGDMRWIAIDIDVLTSRISMQDR